MISPSSVALEGIGESAIDHDDDRIVRDEITEHFDLPELADTMEEATARATASTFLYVLDKIQGERAANEAEYRTLLRYQAERHAARQASIDRQIAYLTDQLETLFGFMRTGPKKKSLNLLGGQLGKRKQADELVVEDDDRIIEWVKAAGPRRLLRTKVELSRAELRKYMESGPQYSPPGAELKQRPDVFFAKPTRKE